MTLTSRDDYYPAMAMDIDAFVATHQGAWWRLQQLTEKTRNVARVTPDELDEELGITVKEDCLAPFAFASHGYERFHLLMPLFLCRRWEGIATPRERQKLAWVRPNDMGAYPMPPADVPLVAQLRDLL